MGNKGGFHPGGRRIPPRLMENAGSWKVARIWRPTLFQTVARPIASTRVAKCPKSSNEILPWFCVGHGEGHGVGNEVNNRISLGFGHGVNHGDSHEVGHEVSHEVSNGRSWGRSWIQSWGWSCGWSTQVRNCSDVWNFLICTTTTRQQHHNGKVYISIELPGPASSCWPQNPPKNLVAMLRWLDPRISSQLVGLQ